MVGKNVQEIQCAGWLGLWFSIFPDVQSLAAQAGAAAVIGSYLLVPYVSAWRSRNRKDTFCGR